MASSCSSTQVEEIAIGPWGGGGGEKWIYKASGGFIKQIVIGHGDIIDSILFGTMFNNQNGEVEYSPRFGGSGGNVTKVDLDGPSEYLTNITVTYRGFEGAVRVGSVMFFTNISRYGPFGIPSNNPVSTPMEGAVIVGFHGGFSRYLDSIGIYVKPNSSIFIPKVLKESQEEEGGGGGDKGGGGGGDKGAAGKHSLRGEFKKKFGIHF